MCVFICTKDMGESPQSCDGSLLGLTSKCSAWTLLHSGSWLLFAVQFLRFTLQSSAASAEVKPINFLLMKSLLTDHCCFVSIRKRTQRWSDPRRRSRACRHCADHVCTANIKCVVSDSLYLHKPNPVTSSAVVQLNHGPHAHRK